MKTWKVLFLGLMAFFVPNGVWAISDLKVEFTYDTSNYYLSNSQFRYLFYYGDVPRSTLPPDMSYADDLPVENLECISISCQGNVYGAFVDRDIEFYAALVAEDPSTLNRTAYSDEYHYDPNAQSVLEPPTVDGFIPVPDIMGVSLCQAIDGLSDGSYLLTVSGVSHMVYEGVCSGQTGFSLGVFTDSINIVEGESAILKTNNDSAINSFVVDGNTVCATTSNSCIVSGLTVGMHTALVKVNGVISNSLIINVLESVASSPSIFDGMSAGDYRVRVDANGNSQIIEALGNNPPTISISADKIEYVWGDFATISIMTADLESDPLTSACYVDGVNFSGSTTEGFGVGQHTVYCQVSDGISTVNSNSVAINVLSGPHISVPANVSLTANVGDISASGSITIANSGNGTLTWAASTTATWLSLSQSNGIDGDSITITADLNGLVAGNYNGDIIFTSPEADNSPMIVPVVLNISDVASAEIAFGAISPIYAGMPSGNFQFATAGDNRLLIVAAGSDNTSTNNVIGVTYAGEPMIRIGSVRKAGNERWMSLFYLLNPTTGLNDVVVNASGSNTWSQAAYYTGVGGLVESTENVSAGTSLFNTALVTTVDGSWIIGYAGNTNGLNIVGAETTIRGPASVNNIIDTNKPINPAGASAVQLKYGANVGWGSIAASFKPAGK